MENLDLSNKLAVFILLMIGLLSFDLFFFKKKSQTPTFKQSLYQSILWISLGISFSGWIYYDQGFDKSLEYLTGYILEEALSIDNLFVIATILTFLKIPEQFHQKILFWGIFGAIVMRAIMISIGCLLISKYSFLLIIFGIVLFFSGLKMFKERNHQQSFSEKKWISKLKSTLFFTDIYNKDKLTVVIDHKRYFTPILLAIILVELSDLIFAVDSIPAIFAVTKDPFIVTTSNIFAILGLRSIYFLISKALVTFKYLKHGLALIIILIGLKLILVNYIHLPVWIPLSAILIILITSIIFSYPHDKNKHSAHIN